MRIWLLIVVRRQSKIWLAFFLAVHAMCEIEGDCLPATPTETTFDNDLINIDRLDGLVAMLEQDALAINASPTQFSVSAEKKWYESHPAQQRAQQYFKKKGGNAFLLASAEKKAKRN